MKDLKMSFVFNPFAFMVLGMSVAFDCSVFAQNHNPYFNVSDVHIGGSDYVFIPPGDDDTPFRTALTMSYRNDNIPQDGRTEISWENAADKIDVYEIGSTSTLNMPHPWNDSDQGDKSLELEAQLDATEGNSQKLQATYTNPDGDSSPVGERDFILVKLDLDIDVNGDDTIDGDDEALEANTGAFVLVNNDDDDEDGTEDKNQSGTVAGEDDLVEINLSLDPNTDEGQVDLSLTTSGDGNIEIWADSTKTTSVDLSESWDLSSDTLPTSLYVEGISESSNAGDVELILTYQPDDTLIIEDSIVLTLLKMDVAAHVPDELVDDNNNLQTGAEIPAADEDVASNLQFVVNDDNDRHLIFNASSYPKDLELQNEFSGSEDDLVAVRFEFPSDIDSGTLEVSANVNSANPEARAYIVTPAYLAGEEIPPTKELVALNPATSIDLSSASNTDLLWELADEGEQTLYIEGLAAKSDLEVKLSFKVNGTEIASESVHMELLASTERTLKVLAYPGKAHFAIVHMNNADNVLRKDHDGYQENSDRVTPIAFRQDGVASSSGVPSSWQNLDIASSDGRIDAVFERLKESPGYNVFICETISSGGGLAREGEQVLILGQPWYAGHPGSPEKNILAHEWLHAFADRSHVNITNDILWGDYPPPEEVDVNNNRELDGDEDMVEPGHGGNVSQSQYSDFIVNTYD